MKIATWNVNSIRARMPRFLEWLDAAKPDVVLLQETKVEDDKFPLLEIEERGYNVAIRGQKSYNGVAILSNRPIDDVVMSLPGPGLEGEEPDSQARYIEAQIGDVRVASIYLPQGTDLDGPRFPYKLRFLERVKARFEELLPLEEAFVFGGDYNVAPWPKDVFDPAHLEGTLDYHPEERKRLREILYLGITDAFDALHPGTGHYTFWEKRTRAIDYDFGLRIDHLLLSPTAADRLTACEIDKAEANKKKSSDHVPIWCEIAE